MLQVSPKKIKSKAKLGINSWCVDTRSVLSGGTRKFYETREDAQRAIDALVKETSDTNKSSDAWKWTFYELAKNYIAQVEKEYRDGEQSKSYHQEKVRHVDCFLDCVVDGKPLADMRVADLTKGMVAHQVMDQLKVKRTDKTVKNICGSVGMMINYAIIEGCRETNPLEGVKRKGAIQTAEGSNKAQRIATDVINNIISQLCTRWQFFARFACTTGVRQGEQRALTWGQIDLTAGKVVVDRAIKHKTTDIGSTKTYSGLRTIPLTRDVLAALKELFIAQGRPNDPDRLVFGTEFNHPVTAAKYLKRIKDACRRAGVAPITWHELRHYYASKLLQAYPDDLWRVKTYMGHSDIRITQGIYGHWLESDADNAAAVDKLSAIF